MDLPESTKKLLLEAQKNNMLDIALYFFWRGIDYEKVDINDSTIDYSAIFIEAARDGCLDVVKFLVDKGIDVNKANESSETAFEVAVFKDELSVVEFLLERGAHFQIDNLTPLAGWVSNDMNVLLSTLSFNSEISWKEAMDEKLTEEEELFKNSDLYNPDIVNPSLIDKAKAILLKDLLQYREGYSLNSEEEMFLTSSSYFKDIAMSELEEEVLEIINKVMNFEPISKSEVQLLEVTPWKQNKILGAAVRSEIEKIYSEGKKVYLEGENYCKMMEPYPFEIVVETLQYLELPDILIAIRAREGFLISTSCILKTTGGDLENKDDKVSSEDAIAAEDDPDLSKILQRSRKKPKEELLQMNITTRMKNLPQASKSLLNLKEKLKYQQKKLLFFMSASLMLMRKC